MSAPAPADGARPAIGRGLRLQWEPAQQAHVLLYPEGMVKLNASAAEILRRCDGTRTLAQIVAELREAYGGADLQDDVREFVAQALARGWLEIAA
ncbi:MAG: pyrroloquinoline quinone biosynthesis peptide chaperone PqqD [Burkholderiaceae bacterium]|nr:pyrroloquinoline quinone biosynthesis peptide chaperone PqqD [Burkholderiaceae bacterium]